MRAFDKPEVSPGRGSSCSDGARMQSAPGSWPHAWLGQHAASAPVSPRQQTHARGTHAESERASACMPSEHERMYRMPPLLLQRVGRTSTAHAPQQCVQVSTCVRALRAGYALAGDLQAARLRGCDQSSVPPPLLPSALQPDCSLARGNRKRPKN